MAARVSSTVSGVQASNSNETHLPLKSDEEPSNTAPTQLTNTDILYRPVLQIEYKAYTRRWFIVFVVCIVSGTNALIWICFSPIASTTATYYGVSNMSVNWLSLVYLVASIPCGLAASWLLDTFGLRISIIIAAWMNLLGTVLRSLTVYDFIGADSKFSVLMVGQTIAAIAQPFILFCPTKLAAVWFPDSQRAIANTLATMANPLGIMVANIIAPKLVETGDDMPKLLWLCVGASGLGVLLATAGIWSSVPPSPPSPSAAESSEPFVLGLKKLAKVPQYWLLLVTFGVGLAAFNAFVTFIEQILCPRGYDAVFSGMCGALMIGIGVIGAGVAGAIVDKTKEFDLVAKVCLTFGVVSGVIFALVSRKRDFHVLTAVSLSAFGFFGFALCPVSMELGVEITYPVAEATSSGLLFISGQILGVIFMVVGQLVAQPLPASEAGLPTACSTGNSSDLGDDFTPQDWTVPNLLIIGITGAIAIPFILVFKGDYRRLRAEEITRSSICVQEADINVPS